MNYLDSLISDYKKNPKIPLIFVFCSAILYTFLNVYQLPVFFIPDILIFIFSIWAIININQRLSKLFIISLCLIIYFLSFSPEKLDIEFNNKFYITIKPLIYLLLLYFISDIKIEFNIKKITYSILILYPLMLIWSITFYYFNNGGTFLTRPYFIFENNFEIPLILSCFIIVAFIYRDKDIRIFFLVSLAVFLTGSRSGLIGFGLVAIPYLLSIGKKGFIFTFSLFLIVVGYLVYVRGLSAFNFSSIDRIQTLRGMFAYFNNDFWEILKHPFGVGIYKKIPIFFCAPLGPWAEWFTGSFFNCDPLLFQSYFTRSIFQLGIYVTFFVPFAFYWELRRVMGAVLPLLILAPVIAVSLSAGGFSNGLSFIGIIFCLLAYNQTKRLQT